MNDTMTTVQVASAWRLRIDYTDDPVLCFPVTEGSTAIQHSNNEHVVGEIVLSGKDRYTVRCAVCGGNYELSGKDRLASYPLNERRSMP